MRTFEIKKSDISNDYRLEPAYYVYSTIIRKECESKGIRFEKMDALTNYILDGEHSAIPRQKEKGIRYLYGRNIKDGIINFDPFTDSSYISYENYEKFKRTYVNEGDLLITIVGTVGKVAVYNESYIGKIGIPRHIAKIQLKSNGWATPEYLMAYFLSKLGKHQIQNITTGNIQPLLSLKNIMTIDIPKVDNNIINTVTAKLKEYVELETRALNLIEQARGILNNELGLGRHKDNRLRFSVKLSDFKQADLWTPEYSRPIYKEIENSFRQRGEVATIGSLVELKKGDEVGSEMYSTYLEKSKGDVPFIRTSDIVNYDIDQYPDYYINEAVFKQLNQDVKERDVLFTKDGKIGMVGMITKSDKAIYSSGFEILRVVNNKYNITPEYLFTALSLKEIGIYGSKKRTVIAATIPHLREERLKEIEIPVVNKNIIDAITSKIAEAFKLKDEKKNIMREVRDKMDNLFI